MLKYRDKNEIMNSMAKSLSKSNVLGLKKLAEDFGELEGAEYLEESKEEALEDVGLEGVDFDLEGLEKEVVIDNEGIDLGEEVDFEIDVGEEIDLGEPMESFEDEELDIEPEIGEEEEFELDLATEAALKVVQTNLVKMSNALDKKGFMSIANVIDQTIIRLAKKKRK